jgi:hypothetical protein
MAILGAHIEKKGRHSMAMSTPVQAQWQIPGDFTRIPRSTQAVVKAMMIARTELSPRTSRMVFIYLVPFRLLRASCANRFNSWSLRTLASTMPVTSSSTEPRQKRSIIWRTARAARLRGVSPAL